MASSLAHIYGWIPVVELPDRCLGCSSKLCCATDVDVPISFGGGFDVGLGNWPRGRYCEGSSWQCV